MRKLKQVFERVGHCMGAEMEGKDEGQGGGDCNVFVCGSLQIYSQCSGVGTVRTRHASFENCTLPLHSRTSLGKRRPWVLLACGYSPLRILVNGKLLPENLRPSGVTVWVGPTIHANWLYFPLLSRCWC